MDNNDQNNDEIFEEEENFAELLEKSLEKPVRLKRGEKVQAVIVKITDEWIFIDLGGKSEGYLDKREFLDADGSLGVREGDTIQAFFLSPEANEQRFTTRIGSGETARAHLEEAWRSGIPVEGVVEKEIKGGFEVKIAGGTRGFCPYSQAGLQRIENPADYVGRQLPFRISEYGEKGRNIVLSHRAVLEEERQARKEALRTTLHEGMTVTGTVTSIRNFGAFLDIDGIEGLIPISEIGWGRVEDIHEYLTVGQQVEVVVMKLDWEKDRFSFSMKQTLADPWEQAGERYPEGSIHQGRVARLTNFGAFVTLEAGVDGLIHISKLGGGKRIHHPREMVAEGQAIDVKIENLDRKNKRVSLALAQTQQTEDDKQEEEQHFRRYVNDTPASMGTLGDMLKTRLAERNKK